MADLLESIFSKSVDPIQDESIQELAVRYFDEICKIYLIQPDLILEHHEVETKTTLQYDGRQLLELIQNADDAAHHLEKPKMLIKLEGDQLIVANMGEPFSSGGLTSIFHSRLSPKFEEKNQIGNKGLGFRSILNWAEQVRIKSGELKIGFSERYSQSILSELILQEPKIELAIRKRFKKFIPAIAVLRVPQILTEVELSEEFDAFDTVIIIDLKPGMAEKIAEQLDTTVNAEMMLFLNHLYEVRIDTPNFSQIYGHDLLAELSLPYESCAKEVALTFLTDGKPDRSTWHIYGKKGIIGDKGFELAVAWQDEMTESSNLLHCFFRTEVTFKFPGLLHGTFELNDNRNELIRGDGYNGLLFEEAANLIAAAAGYAASLPAEKISYLPMRLGIVDSASLTKLIRESGFEAKLKEALVKQKVFPCTRQVYIDWLKSPGYYPEPEFAKHLPSQRFTSLLINPEHDADIKFIEALRPGKYDLKTVIRALAEKRKTIPVRDYANIVIAIQKYLGADVLTENILYDEELELLTTDKPVFFPDTERHQKLPSGVGVQMLNVELFNSIKIEMATTSNPIIIANLKGFNLREFNFREVVEALITHFKPGNTPTANIMLLHKHIFGFYQSETSLPSVWQGGLVPILTRKGKTGFAQKVYFGKEYDQFLTESLFHYDNSRLIAPATKFEQVDTAKWREYLAWIGVAILPRKKMIDAEEAFATFTMRNFDYRKPISGRIFDDGRDFRNHLNSYDEIQVQSIDQLEQLLKNNTPENVIAWLHSDDSIFGLMSKNSELKNSYIGFNFAYGKEVKYIDGTVIPNYLRWKISQTAWLTTESNVKERPDKCTTAVSITADFSPLIEKPKIDFDLLRKKGIDRQRAEDILYNCGVHRSVNTFSTAMLYGMLLSLPELDDSGKKARSIYNQLGQNFEERTLDKLDPTEPNYRKFFQEGQVFCNHGGYEPLNQVFYVNDKHLGESLINQFFTIAMDRRRGKEKILKLFGVPPLEHVDITLNKTPGFHQANASFGLDINQFKPYVYALRQLADTGKERTAIKQARFSLVNDLHVKLVKDAVAHNLVFTDYEFLYLADINQVYLRAPANAADLDDLKEDIHFCSAVAEVFSAIIDVDAQRQQIRELYSKSPFGRDLILTAEQDDPQLRKLASARNALDIVIDRKNDFWRAFARCLGRKTFKGNTGNDDALMGELERIFPKFRDYIIPVFSTINYENCNEEDSCAAIVQLLQQTGIKLEDFNQYYFPAISVAALYTSAFRLEKDSLRDTIKERYYKKCCNVATLRGGFLATLRRFDELVPTIPEMIDFDVTKDIVTAIDQIFGDIPDMDESEIKADAQYYLNKEQLLVLASAQQINKSLTEDFLNDSSAAFSLLFFEPEVSSVAELLQKWASVATGSGGTGVPAGKSKKIQFDGRALFYNDFLDLRQQLDAGLAALQLQKIKLQDIAISKTEIKKRDSDTNKSFKKGGRLPAKNEESGFLGEYLIYQYLLVTTKAIESVKWVSRYAKDCQLSTEDGTGAGYDLEYVPNGGTYPRYVEVKVIGQEDAFHISSNEVRFGEVNKKYHDIFLVRNAHDPAHLQIERISGLFDYGQGGSFNQNEAFTVVNDNYILKFKKTN